MTIVFHKELVNLSHTSPKTNMDTPNDGLEKVESFKIWQFFGLDFLGVIYYFIGII